MGIASYQHVFSANAVADVRAMVRDNSNDFNSNANSTPVEVFQHNWFREGYFKGTITIHHGRHEWKAGVESDNIFLHENFSYIITVSRRIRTNSTRERPLLLPSRRAARISNSRHLCRI